VTWGSALLALHVGRQDGKDHHRYERVEERLAGGDRDGSGRDSRVGRSPGPPGRRSTINSSCRGSNVPPAVIGPVARQVQPLRRDQSSLWAEDRIPLIEPC
jgi:hypothetical protein